MADTAAAGTRRQGIDAVEVAGAILQALLRCPLAGQMLALSEELSAQMGCARANATGRGAFSPA